MTATTCERCGAALDTTEGQEAEREELDAIEAERAAGAAGFDVVFGVDGDVLSCPQCGRSFRLDEVRVGAAIDATDTAGGNEDVEVITCTCPSCHAAGHAVVGARDDAVTTERGIPHNGGTQ